MIRAVSICSNVGGKLDPEVIERCQSLGKLLAKKGLVAVNGACQGHSYEVIRAHFRAGGVSLGISPAESMSEHVERYHLPVDNYSCIVYTGFGYKGRNVIMTRAGQAGIFIGGGMGTLNEFTIMHDEHKKLAILDKVQGTMELVELIQKRNYKQSMAVIREKDPGILVQKLLE